MNKKYKIILTSISTLLGVGAIATSTLINSSKTFDNLTNILSNDSNLQNDSTVENKNINRESAQQVKPLVPLDYDQSVPLLVQENGPIISQKSKISSLDWFGAEKWHIDLNEAKLGNTTFLPTGVNKNNLNQYFGSAMLNFSLDKNNNRLWVLSNSGWRNNFDNVEKQRVMEVDSLTGKILQIKEISFQGHKGELYRKIQVLDSGNVMIYSHGKANFDLYDAKTKNITTISYDANSLTSTMDSDINSMSRPNGDVRASKTFSFLFSISHGVNIAVFSTEAYSVNERNIKNSGKIFFAYVDDNLKPLASNGQWNKTVFMNSRDKMTEEKYEVIKENNITPSSKPYVSHNGDSFPKLSYKLPDNRTLVTIYDKLYIFWPSSNSNGPEYKSFDLNVTDDKGKLRPIESWTTDTDSNVYVKFAGDTKIQKISILGSTKNDTSISVSPYYDISGSEIEDIKNNAKNFVMYNVYGYSGQIMLLNPVRVEKSSIPNLSDENTSNNFKSKKYGLAAAIVDNRNSPGQGDSKGLLNTEAAFTKSSTFNIDDSIIQNKLPSEIDRSDIKISDGGFFTNNSTRDESGNLLYPQFSKEMDDKDNSKKNLKVTVNIDQIPWFVNNGIMPSNIPPLTVTKEFQTSQKIDQRVSWKEAALDYDFLNTLPSKVTTDDVKRFDPFSINLVSQKTSISGETYPKKEYSIKNQDDNTGKITITTKYYYLPVGVEVKKENVLIAEFEKDYTIFSLKSKTNFSFIGQNANNEENISSIPQLKELSQSNLLPSSIDSNNIESILRFINTDASKGFPLSKMSFHVQANDDNGTLKITGTLPAGYYPNGIQQTFSKTYIGLNKKTNYKFNVNHNPSGIEKKKFRPSEIDEQDIYKYFVTYSGYNSSDLSLVLTPNDEIGKLNVKFMLDSSYPDSIANNANGFVKNDDGYTFETTIDGFKTNEEYQTQYQVEFVDDNDISLDEIKKFTPKQIEQTLKGNSDKTSLLRLLIGKQTISSEKDFALAMIKTLGSSIPRKENLTENNFLYNIYYNDPNGEITVKLTFKNIDGIDGEISFIQRFTGFAKGNQVTTNDVLSFKTQSKLIIDNNDFINILPIDLSNKLNDNVNRISEIMKYINYVSGDYLEAINSNKFMLEVIPDNIFGYLTIKIIFNKDDIKDTNSLLSYTVTYNGFMKE